MPKCKYTIDDVRSEVIKKGGILLSTKYRVTSDYIKIQCNGCSKIWEAQFSEILRGRWCSSCAQYKSSSKDVVVAAKKLNMSIVGDIKRGEKIHIRCDVCGHENKTRWKYITGGSVGCKKCAGQERFSYKQVCDFLSGRDIKMMSKNYKNSHAKLKLLCLKCFKKWETSFVKIKACGTGCPYCAGNVKYSQKTAYETVQKTDCELISKYNGANNKVLVKCNKCSFVRSVVFSSVRNGSRCPNCTSSGQNQRLLQETLLKIFKSKSEIFYNYNQFDWLKTKGRWKQHIDILIINNSYTIAIEYDGEQHFMPIRFGNISKEIANKNLKKQKKMDKLKDTKIKNSNDIDYFIRFSYKEDIGNLDYVVKKLLVNGIPGNIMNIKECLK